MNRAALFVLSLACVVAAASNAGHAASEIYVDGTKGNDRSPGDAQRPLKSLPAALAKLKEPLDESIVIKLAIGTHLQ
jgi:hypothetical protein